MQAARGQIERARLQTRAGRTPAALDDYQAYLARYPGAMKRRWLPGSRRHWPKRWAT